MVCRCLSLLTALLSDEAKASLKAGQARRQGQSYIDAIMAEDAVQDIPGGEGFNMRVIPDVPWMHQQRSAAPYIVDIILRRAVENYWLECIRCTEVLNHRVCAVGTSSIGKTKSTAHLIRLLLQKKRTVVYRLRALCWLYEFRPNPNYNGSNGNEKAYLCTVYPEETACEDIESLHDRNTFYIVDPSAEKDTCAPERNIPARVIIVTQPISLYWGDEDFAKAHDNRGVTNGGIFLVHPLWTLDELLVARRYLNRNSEESLSEEDVKSWFYHFGGVAQHVFCDAEYHEMLLRDQAGAIDRMDTGRAIQILSGKADGMAWSPSTNDWPENTVVFALTPNPSDFMDYISTPVSIGAVSKLMTEFQAELWAGVASRRSNILFEPYVAYLLADKPKALRTRPCVDDVGVVADREYQIMNLGGYQQVEYAPDIVEKAIQRPNVLFMSTTKFAYPFYTRQNQLIDFVYSENVDGKIHVHAFKATLGVRYEIDQTQMMSFVDQLGNASVDSAALYFLICPEEFNKFWIDTAFAIRAADIAATRLSMYHVEVPAVLVRSRRLF